MIPTTLNFAFLSLLIAEPTLAIPSYSAGGRTVSALGRRQTNGTFVPPQLNPNETIASYIAALQSAVDPSPALAAPSTDLDSRDWQQNDMYVESVFSVDVGGITESYQISVEACMKLGAVAGIYTFANGSSSSGVTVEDIISDIDATMAKSGSGGTRAVGRTILKNARAVIAEATAYLENHVCDLNSTVPTAHDELRRLLQFGGNYWRQLLVYSSATGAIVGAIQGSLSPQNITLQRYTRDSLANTIVIIASGITNYVVNRGYLQPQEAALAAPVIAWQRRAVFMAGVAAAAASPAPACIESADLENAVDQIGYADDPLLRLQEFDALDGLVQDLTVIGGVRQCHM